MLSFTQTLLDLLFHLLFMIYLEHFCKQFAHNSHFQFNQFSSVTQSCPTLYDPMDCSTPGFPVLHHLPEHSQTRVHWVCDAIQPSHPLLSLLLLSVLPSIRVPSNESALHIRWPKCWSFSFSISPSNEYSGLIFFRMDWLISLQFKGLSRVFSNTIVQKHQFFATQPSL